MKLLSADFITSAAASGDGIPRDGLTHIALAGRSNVGKSSLINALCRAKIARTSAAAGKTRLANIYRVRMEAGPGGPGLWGAYLVDLPGYGYARGGDESAEELKAVAEAYFRAPPASGGRQAASGDREAVRTALLLVDARHPGMDSDVDAARWMDSLGVSRHLVATKIDKLGRSERAHNLKALEGFFGMAALPVSATSGEGLDALWTLIAKLARNR